MLYAANDFSIIVDMLPLLLLLLSLTLVHSGTVGDVLDTIDEVDNSYHKVKGIVKAGEREAML